MQKVKQPFRGINFIALLMVIAVIGYFLFPKIKNSTQEKNGYVKNDLSIAVLPFVNLSNDSAQEYFSDGLTEGVLNSLAHLKGLKVCARTSSFKFRKKDMDVKEIGKQLGVNTLLEGSVQRQGDHVRVTAQLINVKDGFHFWSQQYDENMDDIFALQNKIADAIAEKLEITLLQKDEPETAKKSNPGSEAYELYLKGRSSWNLKTPPELKKAIVYFQQALNVDSSYAAAYSGVADCYTALGYGSFMAPKETFPKAQEAAKKALELDSTLAEAHASLGFYKFYYDWDWAAAEQEFRMAIAMNPNYEIGFDMYGYYLTAMERYDEATTIFKKAKELDPLSVPISTDMGFSFYYGGNYDLAIKELQASLQMNPKFVLTHIWLGRSYQAKRIYPEAIAEYKKALDIAVEWSSSSCSTWQRLWGER